MYIVGGFFFFKQKTAYEVRISDWSSDVCSSDLAAMLCLPLLPGGTKRYSMAVWRAGQQMKGPSCCANRNPAAFVEAFPVPANREIVWFIGHSHQRNVQV